MDLFCICVGTDVFGVICNDWLPFALLTLQTFWCEVDWMEANEDQHSLRELNLNDTNLGDDGLAFTHGSAKRTPSILIRFGRFLLCFIFI